MKERLRADESCSEAGSAHIPTLHKQTTVIVQLHEFAAGENVTFDRLRVTETPD